MSKPGPKRFALKSRPDEVHYFTQEEVVEGLHVGSMCDELGGVGDKALEPSEVEFTDREVTCQPCWGIHQGDLDIARQEQDYNKNLAWERHSPAPQISRRETY